GGCTMLVRPLDTLGLADIGVAGGKGAALGELIHAGFHVPDGFVVTTTAFDEFIAGAAAEIDRILSRVTAYSAEECEAAARAISRLLEGGELSGTVASAVATAFTALGADTVAVRSSATVEDGEAAAWAGQFDTYLGTTRETLPKNILSCWKSFY